MKISCNILKKHIKTVIKLIFKYLGYPIRSAEVEGIEIKGQNLIMS